jgi:MFS family permease
MASGAGRIFQHSARHDLLHSASGPPTAEQISWYGGIIFSIYGWRGLFLVGVLPAFVALLVRWWVKEPERWTHAHEQEAIPLSAIFESNLRRTLVGSALAFVAVFGLWGSTNWAPTLIRELPDLKGQDPATLTKYVGYAIMTLNAGAIFGYLGFGPLADRFSRRHVFAFMCVSSFVMLPIAFSCQPAMLAYLCCSRSSASLTTVSSVDYLFTCPNSIRPNFLPLAQGFASTRDASWPPPRHS